MSRPVNEKQKKRGKSFSLTHDEMSAIDERARHHHRFRNRTEYLLALVEMDLHYGLERDVERLRLPDEPSEIEHEIAARKDEYQEIEDKIHAVAESEINEKSDVPDAIAAEEERKRASRGDAAKRRDNGRARGPKT